MHRLQAAIDALACTACIASAACMAFASEAAGRLRCTWCLSANSKTKKKTKKTGMGEAAKQAAACVPAAAPRLVEEKHAVAVFLSRQLTSGKYGKEAAATRAFCTGENTCGVGPATQPFVMPILEELHANRQGPQLYRRKRLQGRGSTQPFCQLPRRKNARTKHCMHCRWHAKQITTLRTTHRSGAPHQLHCLRPTQPG